MAEQAFSRVTRLAVSCEHAKTIKSALEARGILDKKTKIRPLDEDDVIWHPTHGVGVFQERWLSIPIQETLFPANYNDDALEDSYVHITSLVNMLSSPPDVWLHTYQIFGHSRRSEVDIPKRPKNPLDLAIDTWLKSLPSHADRKKAALDRSGGDYPAARTSSYTVYPPMLLLPSNALKDYRLDGEISEHLPSLYESLCKVFKVTHIALNAPIPLLASQGSSPASGVPSATSNLNVLRSPTGLYPLCGDFGPALDLDHVPDALDFESAFWCTTVQNGIFQTWAPRYTMFSRGNITEKSRILNLGSVRNLERHSGISHTSAVDLYAGIGYFAFSYAEAGVQQVLCWEINPWSVEGLRKGAEGNRWKAMIVGPSDDHETLKLRFEAEKPRLVVFNESNERASDRIRALLGCTPPVRHVNCGYLPSSKDSWKIAVEVIDSDDGGWIHVHENIAKRDIERRKREIVDIFTELVFEVYDSCHRVSCEHLERVKSYAPGVIHCVLDIAISAVNL